MHVCMQLPSGFSDELEVPARLRRLFPGFGSLKNERTRAQGG